MLVALESNLESTADQSTESPFAVPLKEVFHCMANVIRTEVSQTKVKVSLTV